MQASERSINPHKGIYDDKVLGFIDSRVDASPTLNHHYNITFRHRWHLWEFQKAKEAEYSEAIQAVMDMLFDALKDKVLFIIGLGKFSSNCKLTSLHGTFGSQLIKSVSCLTILPFSLFLFFQKANFFLVLIVTGSCAWVCSDRDKRVLYFPKVPPG